MISVPNPPEGRNRGASMACGLHIHGLQTVGVDAHMGSEASRDARSREPEQGSELAPAFEEALRLRGFRPCRRTTLKRRWMQIVQCEDEGRGS